VANEIIPAQKVKMERQRLFRELYKVLDDGKGAEFLDNLGKWMAEAENHFSDFGQFYD